jgi:hypothetical protein
MSMYNNIGSVSDDEYNEDFLLLMYWLFVLCEYEA